MEQRLLHALSVSMTETGQETQDCGSFVADESNGIDVIISTCMRKIVAQLRQRMLYFWQTTGIFIND
jgi:hypothetical protein